MESGRGRDVSAVQQRGRTKELEKRRPTGYISSKDGGKRKEVLFKSFVSNPIKLKSSQMQKVGVGGGLNTGAGIASSTSSTMPTSPLKRKCEAIVDSGESPTKRSASEENIDRRQLEDFNHCDKQEKVESTPPRRQVLQCQAENSVAEIAELSKLDDQEKVHGGSQNNETSGVERMQLGNSVEETDDCLERTNLDQLTQPLSEMRLGEQSQIGGALDTDLGFAPKVSMKARRRGKKGDGGASVKVTGKYRDPSVGKTRGNARLRRGGGGITTTSVPSRLGDVLWDEVDVSPDCQIGSTPADTDADAATCGSSPPAGVDVTAAPTAAVSSECDVDSDNAGRTNRKPDSDSKCMSPSSSASPASVLAKRGARRRQSLRVRRRSMGLGGTSGPLFTLEQDEKLERKKQQTPAPGEAAAPESELGVARERKPCGDHLSSTAEKCGDEADDRIEAQHSPVKARRSTQRSRRRTLVSSGTSVPLYTADDDMEGLPEEKQHASSKCRSKPSKPKGRVGRATAPPQRRQSLRIRRRSMGLAPLPLQELEDQEELGGGGEEKLYALADKSKVRVSTRRSQAPTSPATSFCPASPGSPASPAPPASGKSRQIPPPTPSPPIALQPVPSPTSASPTPALEAAGPARGADDIADPLEVIMGSGRTLGGVSAGAVDFTARASGAAASEGAKASDAADGASDSQSLMSSPRCAASDAGSGSDSPPVAAGPPVAGASGACGDAPSGHEILDPLDEIMGGGLPSLPVAKSSAFAPAMAASVEKTDTAPPPTSVVPCHPDVPALGAASLGDAPAGAPMSSPRSAFPVVTFSGQAFNAAIASLTLTQAPRALPGSHVAVQSAAAASAGADVNHLPPAVHALLRGICDAEAALINSMVSSQRRKARVQFRTFDLSTVSAPGLSDPVEFSLAAVEDVIQCLVTSLEAAEQLHDSGNSRSSTSISSSSRSSSGESEEERSVLCRIIDALSMVAGESPLRSTRAHGSRRANSADGGGAHSAEVCHAAKYFSQQLTSVLDIGCGSGGDAKPSGGDSSPPVVPWGSAAELTVFLYGSVAAAPTPTTLSTAPAADVPEGSAAPPLPFLPRLSELLSCATRHALRRLFNPPYTPRCSPSSTTAEAAAAIVTAEFGDGGDWEEVNDRDVPRVCDRSPSPPLPSTLCQSPTPKSASAVPCIPTSPVGVVMKGALDFNVDDLAAVLHHALEQLVELTPEIEPLLGSPGVSQKLLERKAKGVCELEAVRGFCDAHIFLSDLFEEKSVKESALSDSVIWGKLRSYAELVSRFKVWDESFIIPFADVPRFMRILKRQRPLVAALRDAYMTARRSGRRGNGGGYAAMLKRQMQQGVNPWSREFPRLTNAMTGRRAGAELCSECNKEVKGNGKNKIVCERCEKCFHLSCLGLPEAFTSSGQNFVCAGCYYVEDSGVTGLA